jgi:ribosome-associated protein
MARLEITERLSIDETELVERFVLSSGPGGQNVNKVSTAVELRFSVRESPSLPDGLKQRLVRLAGARMTQDGVLVISAQRFRSQQRNREDALERLFELIRAAAEMPKRRRATRPTLASKERRLGAKSVRSTTKSMRAKPDQRQE